MQLKRYTDYALRTLIYLGLHEGRRCTISEIAAAYGISENHLMKLAHHLGQLGLITTSRGRNGGLQLAVPPEDINLGHVFRMTEGDVHLVECFRGAADNTCPIAGPCVLTNVLGSALAAFLGVLDRYTLQDLLVPSPALRAVFSARAGPGPAGRAVAGPGSDPDPGQAVALPVIPQEAAA